VDIIGEWTVSWAVYLQLWWTDEWSTHNDTCQYKYTDRQTDRQTERERELWSLTEIVFVVARQLSHQHNVTSYSIPNKQLSQWDFPSVLWHCWLGDRKGIRPVKCWVLVCWWWRFDRSFASLIAPAVTTTSITLICNKIQNSGIG